LERSLRRSPGAANVTTPTIWSSRSRRRLGHPSVRLRLARILPLCPRLEWPPMPMFANPTTNENTLIRPATATPAIALTCPCAALSSAWMGFGRG
jgi:hypothetical protein